MRSGASDDERTSYTRQQLDWLTAQRCSSPVHHPAGRSSDDFLIAASRWLGSRVVSMLDSGAEGPPFKSQSRRCLRQTVHTRRASVHRAAKLVAARLRVSRVTAGLAESNGSIPTATFWPRRNSSAGRVDAVTREGSTQTRFDKDRKCAENCNKWHHDFFSWNCNQHFGNFKP